MNYAQDALWWKLESAWVRDLAGLLTAPALWRTGQELPVAELLGDRGFRLLLDWDGQPAPEGLAHERLGHYAENLLAYWLQHAPHSCLLAREWRVDGASGAQDGALDFVAQLNGHVYHIELTCKYYAGQGGPETMRGFRPNDVLADKARKLAQQSALSQRADVQAALAAQGIDTQALRRVSIVRGNAFTDTGTLPTDRIYAPNAWTGQWLSQPEQWLAFAEHSRFCRLPRQGYLSPARVPEACLLTRQEVMAAAQNGIYACVLPRQDGFWHEEWRVMYRAD